MKKILLLILVSSVLGVSLAGCDDKDSEIEKIIKESKDINHQTSGLDREVPRVKLAPDSEKQKQEKGDK